MYTGLAYHKNADTEKDHISQLTRVTKYGNIDP